MWWGLVDLFRKLFAVLVERLLTNSPVLQAWLVLGGFIAAGTLLYVIAARQKPEYPIDEA